MSIIKKGIAVCFVIGAVLSANVGVNAKEVLLKEGMQNEDVKQIQTSLKQLGYFENDITGYFGQATKEAVEKFQRDRKFTVDGIVGSATWSSLVGNKTPVSEKGTVQTETKAIQKKPPVAEKLKESLKKGMQNSQVKNLQNALKDIGYFKEEATGYFGEVTKTAVEKFQKDNGMTADGVVGSETWGRLFIVVDKDEPKEKREIVSRGTDTRESAIEKEIIDYAKQFLNVKYVWGGNTPTEGFDCSGYVKYVYKKFGIELERVAADQAKGGTQVNRQNLKTGDLVFFDTDGGHNYINHVGMYIGDGKFIHASSGVDKVVIYDMTEGFYKTSYMTARRYLK